MSYIQDAIARLLALPAGKRAIQPYSFNYGYWNFNSDRGITGSSAASEMFTDAGVGGICPGVYGAIWATNGLNLGRNAWQQVLNAIGASGGSIDYIFGDTEDGGQFSSFSIRGVTGLTAAFGRDSRYSQAWNGITAMSVQMAAEGATIGRIALAPPATDYVIWQKTYNTLVAKLLSDVLYEPTKVLYPNAIVSNYDHYNSGVSYGSPRSYNGHQEYQTKYVGNANCIALYGVVNQFATAWSIDPRDTTNIIFGTTSNPQYQIARGPWTSFLMDLYALRSIKRNSPDVPITPWIASVKYTGAELGGVTAGSVVAPPVGYADVVAGPNVDIGVTFSSAGNSAYYYEMVRHAMLTGVKAFGYFNYPLGFSGTTYGLKPGLCTGVTFRAGLLNNVIRDVEQRTGGFTLGTLDSSPISWTTKQLTSGVVGPGGTYIWRSTIKPGTVAEYISTPNQMLHGSCVGLWIEKSDSAKPEIKPFSLPELFYFPTAKSTNGVAVSGKEIAKWLGNEPNFICTFQGNPFSNLSGTIPVPRGRAYDFEMDPVNPTLSSPWHNVLYELAIDPYMWGARSFVVYWPQGVIGFYNYPFQHLVWQDRGLYSSTTDPAYSPARIKGYTSAINNLLTGRLDPARNGKAGFTAINEPCNVMIYIVTTAGYWENRWGNVMPTPTGNTYFPGSMAFWDDCYNQTGTTQGANDLFYSYLDRFVDEIVSMKGGMTAGTLSVCIDSAANAATPGTIGLFSSLSHPYTRGLSFELADWYIYTKLRENGIPTYCEARPLKEYSVRDGASLTSGNQLLIPGICGATAISDWNNHLSVEYQLWFSDPAVNKSSSFFNRFIPNSDATTIFRWAQNTGPLGSSFDPYKVPLTVSTLGTAYTLIFSGNSASWFYTPHRSLFELYMLSDIYRKFNNYSNTGLTFFGVAYNEPTRGAVIEWDSFGSGLCGNLKVFATNNDQSLTGYWRVPSDNAFVGNRIGYETNRPRVFNPTNFAAGVHAYNFRFNQNPTGTAGYWTLSGMSFWRQNIQQRSMTGFIEMLRQVSLAAVPVGGNSAGWAGATYPFDTFSVGIMPRSIRP